MTAFEPKADLQMDTLKYLLMLGVGVLVIIAGLFIGAFLGNYFGIGDRLGAGLIGAPLFFLVLKSLKR